MDVLCLGPEEQQALDEVWEGDAGGPDSVCVP